MIALAEIGKAHLAVASLRGSDLTQFNDEHPRDAAGRFARVADQPIKDDPRIAREARRKRRQRRGLAEIVGQRVEAARQALDASSLQSLRRERVLPERKVAPVVDPRVKAKQDKPPETELLPKPAIDDESYLLHAGAMVMKEGESVVFLTKEQVNEARKAGKFVVGAANEAWGTKLRSQPIDGATLPQVDDPAEYGNLVGLRMKNPHFIDASKEGMKNNHLASGQQIEFWPMVSPRLLGSTGTMSFTLSGQPAGPANAKITIPVLDVNAFSPEEMGFGLNKAAALWDDIEHPRDPDTGRFMHQRTGPGSPPGPVDPRVARARRHRRRQGRGMAETLVTHEREQAPDPRVRAHAPSASRPEAPRLERLTPRARTPLRETGKPREESATEPKPALRGGRPQWEGKPYKEGGVIVFPDAMSAGLPDIGQPSDKDIKGTEEVYEPIEYDSTGKPIIPSVHDTPRALVDPKIRDAYDAQAKAELRASLERIRALRARKAARKTS